jgi:NAD(P)-dependent dehydrogenase (short-subunit alcohol dehydrogenase family)
MERSWNSSRTPSQTGRRAIVTGANSGIGYPAARELARAGATVVLACRDLEKGKSALVRLKGEVPEARAELELLDLASLASVRNFAARELARGLPLDLLVNNAGVMAPPRRLETVDGFELQFGTNVLGHFALTALLFPALERAATRQDEASAPRVVFVASIAHKRGRLDFEDLQASRNYSPMKSYQQSKLADLMLAFEMDRRLRAAGSSGGSRIVANAAHPGVANTNLFQPGGRPAIERGVRRGVGYLIGSLLNNDEEGALPTLYAAVAAEARGGGYYGPQGFQEMRGGDVGEAKVAPQAKDEAAAARLWRVCEELTGVQLLHQP